MERGSDLSNGKSRRSVGGRGTGEAYLAPLHLGLHPNQWYEVRESLPHACIGLGEDITVCIDGRDHLMQEREGSGR